MQLRYNYRVYPNPAQRAALAKAFGCARVVFNDGLRVRQEAHAAGLPYVKDGELQKQVVTVAKRTDERAWLGEVSSVVLVQSLRDLHTAYRNFFSSLTGKRRGPKVAAPRFKSKKDRRQSIRLTANGFSFRGNGRLYVAKVGELRVRWSRPLPAPPTSVTITSDAAECYWASFVVEVAPEVLPEAGADTGIDLGLRHFAVLSDGSKIDIPRFFRRAEKKLKRMRKSLDRKVQGSRNRAKARKRIARQHARVANQRRDWHHKLSTRIIRENQAVYVETLPVGGMGRTWLAKSVYDAGWAAFVGMLEYKAAKHGRTFVKVDRAFPSSQLCSVCGHRDGPKPLDVREWTCGRCGSVHDRDHNAGKNVLFEGRRIVAAGQAETRNALPSAGKTRAKAVAQRVEAGSRREGLATRTGVLVP
ncbi:RNA-guided endonuclease TnpB family protein [Streptomyces sp. TLI_105]|uniref:RNA-guided endonuclease InsQ/TnpB family protein n=1 Tax=Streptomyces sp. TLI_105 TaxID=1881019 RepID=UPI00089AD214|nr:RNA-guided endonuclease TnpB family protein [Streptomyces sp. TLI_105]SEC78380.1 putative transposase [Streptomyces sp. TLI_105]